MKMSDLYDVLDMTKARVRNLAGLQAIDEAAWVSVHSEKGSNILVLDDPPAALWDAIRDTIRARNATIDARLAELGVEPDA